MNLAKFAMSGPPRPARLLVTLACVSVCVSGCGSGASHAGVAERADLTAAATRHGGGEGGPMPASLVDGRAARGVERTRVIGVRPTTSGGHLEAGYRVTKTSAGVCEPSSQFVAGEVYSCSVGEEIDDPCWPAIGSHAVYCIEHPWLHNVGEVTVSKRLVYHGEPEHAVLWGLGLVSGLRCEAHRGAGERSRGLVVSYKCGSTVGLLGVPVRASRLWRIRVVEYRAQTRSYALKGEEGISLAWYGASNGESALPG
jgi:hypothetical protein